VPLIELGPGTGAFTQALLDRGVAERALALVEADEALAANLRLRFPQARVLAMNAANLERLSGLFDEPAAAVVSGLPLLSLPPDDVASILRGVLQHMREDGALYQFTYVPRCPVPRQVMDELKLQAVRVGSSWLNLPPAFVFRVSRRP
jgi:phospholipid N-methyltransferase